MVLHRQELPSATVIVVAVATSAVQVVAAKVVVVPQRTTMDDPRVAGAAAAVVVAVATVHDVIADDTMTAIHTAAVVELAVARPVLVVAVFKHERTGGEIVHRLGPRPGRRVQVEERRLLLEAMVV